MQQTIPVIVLSGYLGSGKTTLLNYILNSQVPQRVAVIVNDMAELNIDARFVKNGVSISFTEENFVEMSNGCICCTLREDLLQELFRLAKLNQFDMILIESTGISEPVPVAQTILLGENEAGERLSDFVHVHAMVTVVDASRLKEEFNFGQNLVEKPSEEQEEGIEPLLVEQIEFCDVLLLNKIDLLSNDELNLVEDFVKLLQPRAQIIRTHRSQINVTDLLHTPRFNFDEAVTNIGWIRELEKEQHIPETEEHGISSLVFREATPFHAQRLQALLESWFDRVTRSKGVYWTHEEPEKAYGISQAGRNIELSDMGRWICVADEAEQKALIEEYEIDVATWHPLYKDRLNELVVIGVNFDKKRILESLKAALITDIELQQLQEKAFLN